tara:strand:- start:16673 stop:16879 length:207 start_codon:yes stop_codon:yes gene_type:complete
MAIKTKTRLTTVKIVKNLYNHFKHISLDDGDINLQKLVNRSIMLYINDEEFRKKVNESEELKISGSSF